MCIRREASSGARRHLSCDFGSDGLMQIKSGTGQSSIELTDFLIVDLAQCRWRHPTSHLL
jgi:hypothetical protein